MTARKISFDCTGHSFNDEEWEALTRRIDARLTSAGLPSLFGDEWDESEDGCVLEGTPDQIAQVKDILLEFPLTVWEFDRNDRPQRIN